MNSAQDILVDLQTRFADALDDSQLMYPDRIHVTVKREQIVAFTDYVFNTLFGRLVMSIGTDKTPINDHYEVTYMYSLDKWCVFLMVKEMVPASDPTVPSVTGIVTGANWNEREVYDLLGVKAVGHPDPRRLVLSDDWPDDVFPLRRSVPYNYKPPFKSVPPPMREPDEKEKNATIVGVGPFFPTLEEAAYFRLYVEGERIVSSDYRGFFAHRGIEKMTDTVLDYNQVPFMAERICGICGFVHSACFCMAVEQAAEIQIPPRAQYIRTIMMELERIHSHLLWVGLASHYLGFDTVLMQSWRIREPIMWLVEQITGNRKTYGLNLPGGVRRDLTPEFCDKMMETLEMIEKEAKALVGAASQDGTIKMRLADVGVLTPDDARRLCVVGPTARASGVNIDARKDYPYGAFPDLDFKPAVQHTNDIWGRFLVRAEETFTSIDLIRQMLAKLPAGELMVPIGNIPPWREGVGVAEAPRGECIHYVETGLDNRPYRWRIRAATYPQLQAVPYMLKGMQVADFPIIVGSIDPCFSCTERVVTVDQSTRKPRIYTERDFVAMSRKKSQGLR